MADQTAWPAGYPAGDDGPASPLAVTGLFAGVFDHGTAATGDAAWFQALLQAEAGLARALERAGRAPAGSGAAVTEAATVNGFSAAEVAEVARASALTGNPVPGLARVLARRVPDFAAPAVHQGATSQDIMDTAAMLLARSSLEAAARDVAAAAEAAARLAREHAGTLMIGRTLLQQAVPVTFGLVAAGWLDGLDSGAAGLAVASRRLAVQFGGAAGTLASLGADGPRVAALLGQELGLAVPPLPWHTERLRVIDVAMALARVTATLGKIARDVTLLAQSEVGEASEGSEGGEGGGGAGGPRRGGSSAMPNKANPVASVAILGCARQVPGLLATLVASAEHEHQRAAGAWHAEWEPFTAVLRLAGSAAAWGAELLGDLRVDPARMAANLAATGGLPLAERVTGLLAGALGRPAAHDLVAGAAARAVAAGRPLREELLGLPEVGQAGITAGQVDEALDPAGYVGAAARFTAAALRAHEEQLACAGGREPR